MSADAGAGTPTPERRVAGWIGKAVRVEGNVVCTEDLTIDGQVTGSIDLGDHDLIVGIGAEVTADLTAKSIVINGAVTGHVRATEKLDLRATGSVEGNIKAPRLLMAGGAIVNGTIDAGKYGT